MNQHDPSATILWSHPTAILAIDGGMRVRYANRSAVWLLATTDESLEGQNVVELFGGEESLIRALDHGCEAREERRLKLTLRRGECQIEVGMTISACLEGTMPLRILSFRDITARQLLDNRVGQLERLASAERLVGGLAHQLRNPLAAISALVENLVAEMPSSDPRVEYTSRMLNQVTRMERLIRACLELGLDSGVERRRSIPEHIGVAAIDSFESLHGVAPKLVAEAGCREVVVCEKQIVKCLGLLLENAFDACGDASKMELSAATDSVYGTDQFVCFVVRDEGPGIARRDLGKLFEPFYTTQPNKIGLGLAAAQALAVHNGGAIEVRSKPGDTQFLLRLPAAETPEQLPGSVEMARDRR
ncbi:MAG: ATP-binding protein [Acidobacteriota bacterium]